MLPFDTSRRETLKLLGAGAGLTAIGTGNAAAQPPGQYVLKAKTMVGNDLTGADGAIRGINAGGLPWVLDRATVSLKRDGSLKVDIDGLVIDPEVDNSVAGTNPVPEFKAIVSCLTPDSDSHTIETLRTDPVSASEEGDAKIHADLELPDGCLAPIVFVSHPDDPWFAVTGA